MSNGDGRHVEQQLELIVDRLAGLEASVAVMKVQVSSVTSSRSTAFHKARQHYRSRRKREALFGKSDLFGEPAWDILLDLFIAAEEARKISVSSLCIASAVPATTALRWIAILEAEGLIERSCDPADARRVFIALCDDGYAKMKSYFDGT
jgi:DNA-binding MarR family transcriptional regulator